MTAAAYAEQARAIIAAKSAALRPARVVILATFTIELIRDYLVVEGARRGLLVDVHFGGFGQLEQAALDPASTLYAEGTSAIVVAARIEDLLPDFWTGLAARAADAAPSLKVASGRLAGLVEAIRARTPAPILLCNFTEPALAPLGLAGALFQPSPAALVAGANEALARACGSSAAAFIVDCAQLRAEVGAAQWHDSRSWHTARMPWGAPALQALAARLARMVRALTHPPAKCLALDLDNTLWGGIVGEDGLGGIALGEEYPGNAYKTFQRYVKGLRDRGVLLAIASKNNERDALEVFQRHSDMVLRREDFAAVEIGWGDKASSLRRIAERLNIGLDAVVFFDDSPVERAWVREQLPEVTVIEAPAHVLGYVDAIEDSAVFDQLLLSAEDTRRSAMYQEEQRREELRQALSPEEFLQSLALDVTIGDLDGETLGRVTQLVNKTNQFNLTTRRYTSSDLTRQQDAGAVILWLRARDRFGDNGLVAVASAIPEGADWRIDLFLMSCRVIGRQLEDVLLWHLAQAVKARGGAALLGEYLPAPKNGLVRDFYRDRGFSSDDENGTRWRRDTEDWTAPAALHLMQIQRTAAPAGAGSSYR